MSESSWIDPRSKAEAGSHSIRSQITWENRRLRVAIRRLTLIPIVAGAIVVSLSYMSVRDLQREIKSLSRNRDSLLVSKSVVEKQLKLARGTLSQTQDQLVKSREAAEYVRRGINCYQQGDFGQAIKQYEQAVAIDSTNFVVYDWLGYAFYRHHDYEDAIEQLRHSVSLNRRYARGYYNLALALWKAGDRDAAVAAVDSALRLEPAIRNDLLTDGQFTPFYQSPQFKHLLDSGGQ